MSSAATPRPAEASPQRLGVAGWPVAHSRSPQMQNAAIAALGLAGTWHYQRLPVPPELFEEIVRALPQQGFHGINVTIPHKQSALALATEATAAARAIGAANTLTFLPGGEIAADNTDAPGLLAALPDSAAGRSVTVLGAGGTARAAVWALAGAGAGRVSVWNRTAARAEELADRFGAESVTTPAPADIVINTTSVGLSGEPLGALPVDGLLVPGTTVVDFVYRQGGTELIEAAAAAGCATVDGLELLVRQGALSLEHWTGRQPDLDVMRAAC